MQCTYSVLYSQDICLQSISSDEVITEHYVDDIF